MSSPTGGVPDRTADQSELRAFCIDIARLLADDKCEDVLVLDVRGLSQVTDYILVATGTSDRQMRAVAHHVNELGEERGYTAFRTHTDEKSVWVLVDFVYVVVNLFEPNARALYDLEMLWGDAERVAWQREGDPPSHDPSRDRAGLHARPNTDQA